MTHHTETTTESHPDIPRLPPGLCLAIGSMPHRNPLQAIELIHQACPEAPCWPQLPSLGFQENMMTQFTEGIPCLRIDWDQNKLYFTQPESSTGEMTQFYEKDMEAEESGDYSSLALSPSFTVGLYPFVEWLQKQPPSSYEFVKGQITGPLTFGLTILDQEGVPALFNEALSDVVRKGILMKSLWQAGLLKPFGRACILFVDEPILTAFGSAAYINLSREKAVSILRENFTAVKEAGCLVGSHCCGNTDWSLMVEAGVDIINFDAFAYRDTVGLYLDSISSFLQGGGYLAWGIVPSESMESRPSVEELLSMLLQGIELLAAKGLSRETLCRNLILTTSCGLGTLSEQEAEKCLEELNQLSLLFRKQYPGQGLAGE